MKERGYVRFVMAEITGHGQDMVLDVAKVETDLAPRRNLPLLVAALGETLDHVGFVAEEPIEAHDFLPGLAHAPEHVAAGLAGSVVTRLRLLLVVFRFRLFFAVVIFVGVVELQDGGVDFVYFFFDGLDEGGEDVGDVIYDGV